MAKRHQCTWNNHLFGIANAYGDPWTYRVFGTEDDARAYLAMERHSMALPKHRVVPISVTVRVIKGKPHDR